MASDDDEFVIEIEVDEKGSANALLEIEKQGKRTKHQLSEVASEAKATSNSLSRAFSSLVLKLASLGAAMSLARFVKNLADANLRLKNLAVTSGTSAKSLRALQMQFKALGYAENSANAGLEAFTKSVADYKYKGELSGQMEMFTRIGVSVLDAKGNARDYYELLVEAGEKALRNFGGNVQEASLYLRSLGASQEQINVMLDKNARANMNTNKESAATSDKAAEAAEKLNQSIILLQETFQKFVLNIEKRFGIFETLIKLLNTISNWCSGRPSQSVLNFFKGLGEILSAIETTVVALINIGKSFNDYVIQPIIKVLDLAGEVISKFSGGNYESKESWTGDGKPLVTKNDITGERSYSLPSFGVSSSVSGGSPGASSDGYSYGGSTAGDVSPDAESSISRSMADTYAGNSGKGYAYGADTKDLVDCSAYVRKIGQAIVQNNPGMFGKGDSGLFSGTSETIMEKLEKRAGGFLSKDELDPSRVKAGTIIGMDTGGNNAGRKYGIDHIVAVYRDPKTGRMMVTQSSSWNYNNRSRQGAGVQTIDYATWYSKGDVRRAKLFAVNMLSFANTSGVRNATKSVGSYSSGAVAMNSSDQMGNIPVIQRVEKDSHNTTNITLNFGGRNVHQAVGKNMTEVYG